LSSKKVKVKRKKIVGDKEKGNLVVSSAYASIFWEHPHPFSCGRRSAKNSCFLVPAPAGEWLG